MVLRRQIKRMIRDLEATGIRKILQLSWRSARTAISAYLRVRYDRLTRRGNWKAADEQRATAAQQVGANVTDTLR